MLKKKPEPSKPEKYDVILTNPPFGGKEAGPLTGRRLNGKGLI
jgi:16S rRNA G1207 methylase RsmC